MKKEKAITIVPMEKCDLCKTEGRLIKSILRVYSNGWTEKTISACEDCFKYEGLKEAVEIIESKVA